MYVVIHLLHQSTIELVGATAKEEQTKKTSNNFVSNLFSQSYLQMYGWTTPGHMVRHLSSGGDTQADFKDVVKEFQTFFQLNVTGALDEPTIELMKKPRCANADVVRKLTVHVKTIASVERTRTFVKLFSNL